jgi:iron complex transport system permease protein
MNRAAGFADTGARRWPYSLLILVAFGVFALELQIGAIHIPAGEIVKSILHRETVNPAIASIVMELRMPRAVTAALAGCGLAVCGLLLQTLFRNPLAGPWAIGITAGAQLSVAFVVMMGGLVGFSAFGQLKAIGNMSLTLAAAAGSSVVLLIMGTAARRVSAVTLLIIGLMMGFLAQGGTNILLHFTNETQAKVYGSWNEANYNAVTWDQIVILAPLCLFGIALAQILTKSLNALLLGGRYAQSLGLHVQSTRLWSFISVVALAGTITAHCGPIMFIDIIVPHICRGLLRTSDHRVLLPAVILAGAIIGMGSDVLVNAPWDQHFLHINSVNAVLGAPIVIWVVARHRSVSAGSSLG